MTQKGLNFRRILGIIFMTLAIFFAFAMVGGALNWASTEGGGFYWIATLFGAVVYVLGLISLYQDGKEFLGFYDETISSGYTKKEAEDWAKAKCLIHLNKSKTFQKHWIRKTCSKD